MHLLVRTLWAIVLCLLLVGSAARAQFNTQGWGFGPANNAGGPSGCPDNDGSSGATVGGANQPALLSGYAATINGAHGLNCKVAGVDYRVGLIASPSLADPTAGGLPSGATYSSGAHTVTIASNNVTFNGWDMSVAGGLGLVINSGVSGTIITNNKFLVQSPNCMVPMLFSSGLAGTTTVEHNTIDGGGAACAAFTSGFTADVYMVSAASGATFIYEWNVDQNISQDGMNVSGPASGTPLTLTHKYNLLYQQGWSGHPDGVQFAGGLVTAPVISHDTYYNPVFVGGTAGTQPFHVEAQLTATISNGVVSYNTLATPGTCNGGTNFPVGCSVNFDIACKQDAPGAPTNVNTGFSAYGNYIDWSGAIAALADPTDTGSQCTGTTWGSPQSNYDMVAGTTLTTAP